MKNWLSSKTIWFNLIAGLLVALNYWQGTVTNPQTLQVIAAAIAGINWILRWGTDKGITLGKAVPVLIVGFMALSTSLTPAHADTGLSYHLDYRLGDRQPLYAVHKALLTWSPEWCADAVAATDAAGTEAWGGVGATYSFWKVMGKALPFTGHLSAGAVFRISGQVSRTPTGFFVGAGVSF